MGWIPGHGACDACGAAIDEKPDVVGVVIYGPDEDGWYDNVYEWQSQGVYCPCCARKLADGIVSLTRFPVTLYGENNSKAIKSEISLIKASNLIKELNEGDAE